MPPVRTSTLPAVPKPQRTERSHEENQERAYVAASRRSDRSLEARVESARRASEIHKKRTGRSLRVTEQDVINEEMYEEEDDDLPMQYRRLAASLHTPNLDLTSRVQAYLANRIAINQALNQVVNASTYQNDSNAVLQNMPAQYLNPTMMQLMGPPAQQQQNYFQGHSNAASNTQLSGRSNSYRSGPYPGASPHQYARPNGQGRSASTSASPHELQQPQSMSAQTSPVDKMKFDDRRMSLPAQNVISQTSGLRNSAQQLPSPTHDSPIMSRNNLSSSPTQMFYNGDQFASQQMPAPPQSNQFNAYGMRTPFNAMGSFGQFNNDASIEPLSMQLPLNDQQLLGSNAFYDNDSPWSGKSRSPPKYSYNPNGKRSTQSPTNSNPTTSTPGLEQTLTASTAANTGLAQYSFSDAQQSNGFSTDAGNPTWDSSNVDFGFGDYGEQLKTHSSGFSSGQITPGHDTSDWSSFLNNDAFGDASTGV